VVLMATVTLPLNEIGKITGELFSNRGLEVYEGNEGIVVAGKRISLKRNSIEAILGRPIKETMWRVLFANRDGEVKIFNSAEVLIGDESPEGEEIDKGLITITGKVDSELKDEIDHFRGVLNLTQNDFVLEALKEYVDSLKEQGVV